VYAIGDVAGGPYLAHKASKEGEIAAEVIAGHEERSRLAGHSGGDLHAPGDRLGGPLRARGEGQGARVKVGKFPFSASGRAMAVMETEGFVKVIGEKTGPTTMTTRSSGCTSSAPRPSDLISEGALAMEMDAFVEDIGLTIHPHPTLGETVMEAAKAAIGEAVHMLNR
jgi:dihydrolipoamide dehydrogenase